MTPTSAQMPTLEMVAARAGVSRATVSRVVNGSPKVTQEVIASVNEAIEALGYVPNRAARSLASRRTQVIALVVPESTAKVFADPFFASVVQGVAFALTETDYTLNLLIASEATPDKTRRYLRGGNVDGAIVVSHHSGDHSYLSLGTSLPVVFVGRPLTSDQRDTYYVDVDNVTAAREATQLLIDAGRTRIATIAGRQDMPPGIDRLAGWRQALEAAGLESDLIEYGDFEPELGSEAMRRLLERGEPIDGLFAASDQMAVGAYSAIREAGLRIPEDIAVVGFDNDIFGVSVQPALTTVDQHAVELGATIAERLVQLIEGDAEAAPKVTVLPTEIVVRASV